MQSDNTKIVVVFSGTPIEAELIKEMLIRHGINANTQNPNMGTIAPWHVSAGGVDPVDVIVLKDEEATAHDLIKNYKPEN